MGEDDESIDGTPGWDAIEQALARLYPDQEPLHYAPSVPASLGGEYPLDGISIYRADGPRAHWHLVSFGLSELYEKDSEDPDQSGYGFELTFRLARPKREERPPMWAIGMLQNVASYVVRTGNTLEEGDRLPLNGPIALGHDTEIHAATFVLDSQLGRIETPHGRLKFLQLVGVTMDEIAAMQRWNSEGVIGMLARTNPRLVTSLARRSIMDNPAKVCHFAEKSAAEGSSSNTLYATQLAYKKGSRRLQMQIGAHSVESLRTALAGRIPLGRDYSICEGDRVVLCRPSPSPAAAIKDGRLTLDLTPSLAHEMHQKLTPRRGLYRFDELPAFEIKVVPTEIKGADGKVLSTVG